MTRTSLSPTTSPSPRPALGWCRLVDRGAHRLSVTREEREGPRMCGMEAFIEGP